MCVSVGFFLVSRKDEGRNPIHLLFCSSFHIIKQGKYPAKKMKTASCERKSGEKNPHLSDHRVTKHTIISQKCFVVMLKSNCKLNLLNKKRRIWYTE